MKIYTAKYALAAGILSYDAEIEGSMATARPTDSLPMYFNGEGREWHRTAAEAIERAEEMRIKKLQALDKKMKKISEIIFHETTIKDVK